jgi:hypothetical protein
MVPDVFGGMNEDVKLEPLRADAELESGERMAKDNAKQANKPLPSKKLTRKQKKFVEDCDGTWYYVGGEMVCLANESEEDQ